MNLHKNFIAMAAALDTLIQEATRLVEESEAARPSTGYAPLLEARGIEPIFAKGIAQIALRHGRRRASEDRQLPEVVCDIRYLATHHRRWDSIMRRVDRLLETWHGTSIIEAIFENAGVHEARFIHALERVSEGHRDAMPALRQMAQSISPHLTVSKGPRLTEASAAHEFFLKHLPQDGRPRRFTRVIDSPDFSDPLTEAMRTEFGNPDLTPVSAARRLKLSAAKKLDEKVKN